MSMPVPKKSTKFVTTRKIGESEKSTDESHSQVSSKRERKRVEKKVIYLEIDDEITTIYDRIKNLKIKNIYIVAPKRAVIFQSIVNLKILKRKADELEKNIYIITNDQNGIHLATKIGLNVYDKLEGHEHPSLVSGKLLEEHPDITPLKASINTLDDDTPTRRTEKKFAISDFIKRDEKGKLRFLPKNIFKTKNKIQGEKKKINKGKLVLIAPNRQALISLVVISLIILLTITYIALPGATISLIPKTSPVNTSVNVTLADIELNKTELDTNTFHAIPSYEVTKKIQKVLTYQSTGKDFHGANASGTVTIFNSSDHVWTLVEKTRFQTDTGMIFRSQQGINVPPAKNGSPGTFDVNIVADPVDAYNQVVGDKGNLKQPTKFFLPGLSAENRQKLNAESKTPFSGGTTAVTKRITKEDLAAAKVEMISDLKASAQAELESSIQGKNLSQKTNLVLLVGTNAIQMGDPAVTIPPNLEGVKAENFDVKGEMVATGVAYSQDDLMNILKTELKLKKNPEKKLVHIDENSLTYRILDMDPVAKKVKITATINGIEEYEISPEKENGDRLIKKIKEHVVNKDIHEAAAYIQNLPEIDKVKIDVWPAWAPTLPGIPDNIKVVISNPE